MYKESTMLPFVFKWPSYSSVYSYTKLYYKHNEKSILYLLYKQVKLSRIVQRIMHQQKDAFCQTDFHKLHAHFFPLLEYTCCMVGLGLSSFMTIPAPMKSTLSSRWKSRKKVIIFWYCSRVASNLGRFFRFMRTSVAGCCSRKSRSIA